MKLLPFAVVALLLGCHPRQPVSEPVEPSLADLDQDRDLMAIAGRFSLQTVEVPHSDLTTRPADIGSSKQLVLLDTATGRAWTYNWTLSNKVITNGAAVPAGKYQISRQDWLPLGHTNRLFAPVRNENRLGE